MTDSANADPQIIRREVAREQGLIRYFTGEPCIRGHVVERQVADYDCVECRQERYAKRPAAKVAKILERARQKRAENPEEWRAYIRKWRAANRNKNLEYGRKQYASNPAKANERVRKRRTENPAKWQAYDRKRKASPLGRLRGLCEGTARRLELGKLGQSKLKLLGYGPTEYIAHLESTLPIGMTMTMAREAGYHVDHIVPLSVINDALPLDEESRKLAFRMAQDLDNLQMLPGAENMSKSASFKTVEQTRLFDVLCSRYLTAIAA